MTKHINGLRHCKYCGGYPKLIVDKPPRYAQLRWQPRTFYYFECSCDNKSSRETTVINAKESWNRQQIFRED